MTTKQIQELEKKLAKLRARGSKSTVDKCIDWVRKVKLANKVVKRQPASYERKDGSKHKAVDIFFDNGLVMRAGEQRFWKVA